MGNIPGRHKRLLTDKRTATARNKPSICEFPRSHLTGKFGSSLPITSFPRNTGSADRFKANPPRSLLRNEFDFEYGWPLFPGDEEAVMLCVVGDPVQDCLAVQLEHRGKDAGKVNPANDTSVLRRNAHDTVAVPNVCVYLALDKLKLIELLDLPASIIIAAAIRSLVTLGTHPCISAV
jgi:hypothetical protein